MNPYTCTCGQAYMRQQWTHCPKCGAKTGVTATKAQKPQKRLKSQSTRQKPLSVQKPPRKSQVNRLLATLKQAGMATDKAILAGLRTGAVAQAISWQLQYDYVLDYLQGKGYDVSSYRYRVVCGSEILEAA